MLVEKIRYQSEFRKSYHVVNQCTIPLNLVEFFSPSREFVSRFYGVMAITLDFESNNPSSNLGRTLPFLFETFKVDFGVVLFTDVVVSKVLKSFSFGKRLIKCYLQTLLMHLKICSVVAKKCDDLKSEIRVIFDLTIS